MLTGIICSWSSAITYVVLISSVMEVRATRSASSRLLAQLLDEYGPPAIRPVRNISTVTTISMRLLVTQVISLNEIEQTVQISGWMKWEWYDEFMTWDPAEHDGVEKIFVSTHDIWMPDITLYKNVDTGFERYKDLTAIVYYNGLISWKSPTVLTFTCHINARLFPFDTQICGMKFSSWNFHGGEIDMVALEGADTVQSQFAENGVWELNAVTVERVMTLYSCCPDGAYPELVFSIYLKRRPLYHILSIIVPCLLLSFLNLTVFLLPPEAGEKVGLGVTSLLALVLFQQLVSSSLPPSSDNSPIITYYFTPMITISCVSVINAVFVLKLFYHGSSSPVPSWLRTAVLHRLAAVVFYTKPYADGLEVSEEANKERTLESKSISEFSNNHLSNIHAISNDSGMHDTSIRNGLHKVTDDTKKPLESNAKAEQERTETDWQNVANIWDKFMLLFMTILTIAALFTTCLVYVVELK